LLESKRPFWLAASGMWPGRASLLDPEQRRASAQKRLLHHRHSFPAVIACQSGAASPSRSAARLPGVWHPRTACRPGTQVFAGAARGPSSALAAPCSPADPVARGPFRSSTSTLPLAPTCSDSCWARASPQKGPSPAQEPSNPPRNSAARPNQPGPCSWLLQRADGNGKKRCPPGDLSAQPLVVVAFNPHLLRANTQTRGDGGPHRFDVGLEASGASATTTVSTLDHLPSAWRTKKGAQPARAASRLSARSSAVARGEMEADVPRLRATVARASIRHARAHQASLWPFETRADDPAGAHAPPDQGRPASQAMGCRIRCRCGSCIPLSPFASVQSPSPADPAARR